MIECKIADILLGAFMCALITMAILGAVNLDGALEGTNHWMYFLTGAFSAAFGCVLGGSA